MGSISTFIKNKYTVPPLTLADPKTALTVLVPALFQYPPSQRPRSSLHSTSFEILVTIRKPQSYAKYQVTRKIIIPDISDN